MKLTKKQRENIQIDYGIVFLDYGETTQRQLAPTRGGGSVTITPAIRDVEYDGSGGKEKGMQIVDSVTAVMTVPLLDTSMENLAMAMPYATLTGDGSTTPYKLSIKKDNLGVIPDTAYHKNITLFAKVIGGGYKKITYYNSMHEGDFGFTAAPKAEGIINLSVYAHWNSEDDTEDLVDIEDIDIIVEV